MANKGQENLIPIKERSSEEVRKMGKKGGIASGVARRRKKTIKEALKILLEEGNYEDGNGAESIAASAMYQAIHGDVKAMQFVRDTVGEKPVDRLQVEKIDEEAMMEVRDLVEEATDEVNSKESD